MKAHIQEEKKTATLELGMIHATNFFNTQFVFAD